MSRDFLLGVITTLVVILVLWAFRLIEIGGA
jgi:hypothetical protein